MAKVRYTVIVEPEDDGGFSVHVPELPGCHTQGDTEAEALRNAREAIEGYLLVRREQGARSAPVTPPRYRLAEVEVDLP